MFLKYRVVEECLSCHAGWLYCQAGAGLMTCYVFINLGVLFAVRNAAVLQVLACPVTLSTGLTPLQVH